ncbi:MAG TPA: hypothetical protein VMV98_07445, partial [Acidobacteriaceae bacterium]|nr:hypothetical protein [Acidobacteriaceae bacterium]
MERTFYRGTAPGETQRIPEVFTAAEGKTFVARQASSARNYGESIESIVARPDAKILREEDAAFWKLIGRRKPANGWIGSATRKGETVIDAVNDAIRKAEKAGYDIISFSQDADMGTVILNEGAVTRQATSPLTLRPDDTLAGTPTSPDVVPPDAPTAPRTPMQAAVSEAEAVIDRLDTFRSTGRLSASDPQLRRELGKVAKRNGVTLNALLRETMWQAEKPDSEETPAERAFVPASKRQDAAR